MSARCQVCGKKKVHGHRTIHVHSKGWRYRAPKTKRTWLVNLRKVKITAFGPAQEVIMCMSCYKRYNRDGVDFLKKYPRLYNKLLKLRLVQ